MGADDMIDNIGSSIEEANKSYEEYCENRKTAGCLIGRILMALTGITSLLCCLLLLPGALTEISAKNWIRATCTVDASTVDGITYRYRYMGREHQSSTYSLSGRGVNLMRRFPRDSETTCYVNPNNPAQAVLDTSVPSESYLVIGYSFVFIILLLFIGYTFFLGKKK
ncbi:MAG: DUF3592 domain-containing protein [Candidatus Eremiobacteraeota bacterium]|nr:DUF3592 domain-containing protein [Candidatus Eremiobacteraeota bacterium]